MEPEWTTSDCEELNRTEEAQEWCDRAVALIEESDIEGIESEARRFRRLRAGLSGRDPDARLPELRSLACEHVLEQEGGIAPDLFEAGWQLREPVPTADETYGVAVAAGIGVAAHVRIFDDPDVEADYDLILETGRQNSTRLPPGPRALLTVLDGGEPAHSPAELREMADSKNLSDREQTEARAFAFLIEYIIENSNSN